MEELVDGLEYEVECSGAVPAQIGMAGKQMSVSGDHQSAHKQILSSTVTS